MAGSGRKRKREEKAKTKLKKSKTAPGKHLPKGTNETRTEFKVAKIVIPGQKGEAGSVSGSGPVTNKKLGLKEVLAKLPHFSTSVRQDGLEGLKELLSGSEAFSLVSTHLAALVTGLLPLAQDTEKKIRKLAQTVFSIVLSHAPAPSLAPLHPFLSAHLCCALTHIDTRIQIDGLETLDSLISEARGFIAASVDAILPNCLDQISNKKKASGGGGGPAVAANLSESMTSLQWRVSVLSRVDRILSIVTPASLPQQQPQEELQFTPGLCCPITFTEAPSLPLASLTRTASVSSLQDHLLLLLPLLLETWVEARAVEEKTSVKKTSILAKEVAELLSSEAGILDKLVRRLEQEDRDLLQLVKDKFGFDLATHFFSGLPYSCPKASCVEANLQLASLAVALGHTLSTTTLTSIISNNKTTISSSSRLRLIARLLTADKLKPRLRQSCVSGLVGLVEEVGVEEQERREAATLLRTETTQHPTTEVEAWLSRLPQKVLDSLEEPGDLKSTRLLLDCCLDLARTKNRELANSFMALLPNITSSLPSTEPLLRQKVDWTHYHCAKACVNVAH